ncbi:MAG: hypothetical protein H7326_04250 [Bdellovibrionaceae bacterium]|nr:hypothetical protein [Pseudobdellovibrionaceae bacterium]
MKILNAMLVLFFALNFIACGKTADSASSQDPNMQFDVNDLGYEPAARWPEVTPMNYSLSETSNDVTCATQQQFTSKAAYCMGLQDSRLNNKCALAARQGKFAEECGSNFQEVNFTTSFFYNGFDAKLNKECETGVRGEKFFQYTNQFCAFLKNENLHQGCFWEKRRNKFMGMSCGPEFSPEPI